MELRDKVVLVTGSSTGIGKETAIKFAQKGCKVIVTYNEGKKSGDKVLEECRKYSDAILLHLNVKDDSSIKRTLETTFEKFGGIDVLVNNAGIATWKNLIEQSEEEIEDQIRVNLLGLIKITKAFLPQFYKKGDCVIINISSGAGKEGFPELSVYCATKFGVRGFTQALAQELPKGLRVYCVNPGMTATRMTNYKGVDPEKVAEIIVSAAEEKLGKSPGEDIDIWKYV